MAISEVDFPRGGAASVDSAKLINADMEEDWVGGGKPRKGEKKTKDSVLARGEYGEVWTQKLTHQLVQPGLLALGCVRQMTLELSDGNLAILPATGISKKMTQNLSNNGGIVSLNDLYEIGQLLCVKVISAAVDKGKGKRKVLPKVSCDPAQVNNHILMSDIRVGSIMNASVQSVEDKGYVLNLGVSAHIKGFLSSSPGELVPGQTLLVQVLSTGRVVQLSLKFDHSDDHFEHEKCDLLPGTVIRVNPSRSTTHGLFVTVGNDVKAFLNRRQLPRSLRRNVQSITKPFSAIVVYCRPNSNILGLSALSEVVNLAATSNRARFEDVRIGSLVTLVVSEVTSNNSVIYDLPLLINSSSMTAMSSRFHLNLDKEADDLQIRQQYSVGSEHQCRVLDTKLLDRLLMVSDKASILKQKMVSIEDAKPGAKVKAVINKVLSGGVYVTIYGRIRGFIPSLHSADKPRKQLTRFFKPAQMIACRVLYADKTKNRLILTRRKRFLESKMPIVAEYDTDLEGIETDGAVVQVMNAGMLVTFYNRTKGFIRAKELQHLRSRPELGASIRVRILSVDPDRQRMQLGLNPDSVPFRPESVSDQEMVISSATVVRITSQEEGLETILANSEGTSGVVPRTWLSDSLEPAFTDGLNAVFRPGFKFDRVVLFHENAGTIKASNKQLISDWLTENGVDSSAKFEQLETGQFHMGIIVRKHDQYGYFIQLPGSSALTGLAPFGNVDNGQNSNLQIGQTVLARIQHVDMEKRRFSLILKVEKSIKIDLCTHKTVMKMAEKTLKNTLIEMMNCRKGHSKTRCIPEIGDVLQAKVVDCLEEGLILETIDGKFGAIATRDHFQGFFQSGSSVKAAVLHVDYPECHLQVSLCSDLVQVRSKGLIRVRIGNMVRGRILLVKPDFLLASFQHAHSLYFAYLPSRLHPNTVPLDEGRVKAGSRIELIIREKCAGNDRLFQAILKDDEKLVDDLSIVEPDKVENRRKGNKLRLFEMYTVVLEGSWQNEDHLSAQLRFPGGMKGRLHITELADSFQDSRNCMPMNEFIDKNKSLRINVKVIGFGVKGQPAECTIRPSKLACTRKKKLLLGYKETFRVGQQVWAAVSSRTDQYILFELNPNRKGKLDIIKLSDDESATIAEGQMLRVKIIGLSRKKGPVTLALVSESEKSVEIGRPINARVVNISRSPIGLLLELANGQRAFAGPCEIIDDYDKIDEYLQTVVNNGIVIANPILYDDSKGRWAVSLRELCPENEQIKDKLVTSFDQLVVGNRLRGFVDIFGDDDDDRIFVHLGPMIKGKLKIEKLNVELESDALVTVTVKDIDSDGKITLSLHEMVLQCPGIILYAYFQHRKRTLSLESTTSVDSQPTPAKMSRLAGFHSDKPAIIPIADPGFDWTPKEYTPAKFANLGLDEGESDKIDEEKMASSKGGDKVSGFYFRPLFPETEGDAQSADDFARLISGNPNSSQVWLRYVAFFLQSSDVDKARKTIDRALNTINYREDEQLFNVWTALLNLEMAFGTEETLKVAFERAVKGTDSLTIHKQMARILQNAGKIHETDEIFETMLKKFRHEDAQVWVLFGQHLMDSKRSENARKLMDRALKSVPKTKHVTLIGRFAQMEYKSGDSEQGKTLFESILASYPRKTDIWSVFIDMEIKYSEANRVRPLFERATSLNLSAHKMRFLMKKWLDFEQRHGNEDTISQVKRRAVDYVNEMEEKLTPS